MKLIIDIPDMIYNFLNGDSSWKGLSIDYILNAVKNGKPLEAQPTSDDELIKALKAVRTIHNGNYAPQIDEAIRRLEAQPTDGVERKAVLEGLASIAKAKAKSDAQKSMMGRCMFFVEHLPSVTPQTVTEFADKCKECGKMLNDKLRMNLAETSQDCISRQQALDCFEQTNTRQGAKYAIETLPSVTPERPKGK